MSYSERWAKQLFRELPETPEELLHPGGRNYSDPGFLKLYFGWLDQLIYEDPQAGLKWAKVAPRLALPEAPRGDRIRAYQILGAAYRGVGRLDDAEAPYRRAFQLAESDEIPWEVRAGLLRRLANLRIAQRRPQEALEIVRALDGLKGLAGFQVFVCRAHALLELERYSEAADCYGRILAENKLKSLAPSPELRVYEAAAINLCYVVNEGLGPRACWAALGSVARAKQRMRQRPSLPLYQLQLAEGLIWHKLHSHGTPVGFSLADQAEQAYQRALGGFLYLRLPWKVALASLDLARLYRDLGRWDELLELSLETLQRFRVLSGDTHALTALGLVVDAVRAKAGVTAAIAAAGQTLCKRQQGARNEAPKRVRVDAPAKPPPVGRSNLAMVEAREKLLEAAHAEIPHGFNVLAIIKRSGVNRRTFYHHFKNVEACAISVVDEYMHGMVTDWLERIDAADLLATLATALEEAPRLQLPPSGTAAERFEELCVYWRRGLAEKLAAGQAAGVVSTDLDAEETAACMVLVLRVQDPLGVRGILQLLKSLQP